MTLIGSRPQLLSLVRNKALALKVDAKLLDAIITVESAYDPWAVRYEENYSYIAVPNVFAKNNRTTILTERTCQKISWGLSQTMGGTARFLGYGGPLPKLVDPDLNLTVACKLLVKLANEYPQISDQIAAYNAGSVRRTPQGEYVNQEYVNKVMNVYKSSNL